MLDRLGIYNGRQTSVGSRLAFAVVLLLPFIVAAALYAKQRTIALDMDSSSYLDWGSHRSSAYPLFLEVVRGPLLLPTQLLMLAASIAWVARQAARLHGSVLLAAVLSVGLSINPYLWQLQGMVMSEALSTPLMIAMFGAIAGFLGSGRRGWLITAAVAAGLAAAARPSCLPLMLAPVLVVLLRPALAARRRLLLILSVVAMWGGIVVADRLITHRVHGQHTTSLVGKHLFAKAALIDAPPLDRSNFDPLERRLTLLVEEGFSPVRQVLKAAPAGPVRDALRLHYEVCAQYACTEDALGKPLPESRILNDARGKVGAARLAERPVEAVALAWDEYRGMWQLHPTNHPGNAMAINAFLAEHGPIPFAAEMRQAGFPIPASEQHGYYRVTRPAFQVLGVLMAVLCVVLTVAVLSRRRHPLLTEAFIAALTLQVVLVFGAFGGIGIARYMMGLWPAIVWAIACSFLLAISDKRHGARETGDIDAAPAYWVDRE